MTDSFHLNPASTHCESQWTVRCFLAATIAYCCAASLDCCRAAAEKVTLVLITKMNFDRLLDKQPLLGIKRFRQIARLISLRLRQTSGILLDYLS